MQKIICSAWINVILFQKISRVCPWTTHMSLNLKFLSGVLSQTKTGSGFTYNLWYETGVGLGYLGEMDWQVKHQSLWVDNPKSMWCDVKSRPHTEFQFYGTQKILFKKIKFKLLRGISLKTLSERTWLNLLIKLWRKHAFTSTLKQMV